MSIRLFAVTTKILSNLKKNSASSKFVGTRQETQCDRRDCETLPSAEFWPRGYKTFFMLNSAEHEILNAHKYKNIKKFSFFQAQISLK